MGAKPGEARIEVAPRMMIRKKKVITTSVTKPETMSNLPGKASPKPLAARPSTARSKPGWPEATA